VIVRWNCGKALFKHWYLFRMIFREEGCINSFELIIPEFGENLKVASPLGQDAVALL
jgi:hypothetical protein